MLKGPNAKGRGAGAGGAGRRSVSRTVSVRDVTPSVVQPAASATPRLNRCQQMDAESAGIGAADSSLREVSMPGFGRSATAPVHALRMSNAGCAFMVRSSRSIRGAAGQRGSGAAGQLNLGY